MSWLQNNLKALETYQPELVDALGEIESVLAFAENTPDGMKTVRAGGESGPWVYSRRAPSREVERIVGTLKHVNLQPCVTLGMGLGYVVKEGLAKHKNNPFIVIEDNLPLLKAALELHDFSSALKDNRLVIATDVPPGRGLDLYDLLKDPLINHGLQSLTHSYTLSDSNYSERFKQLSDWVKLRAMAIKTQMSRARLNVENLLLNLPHYLVNAGVDHMIGAMEGKPGIIVGSGPSLERNLDVLKEYSDRVYVHAVSSSLKRMMSEGVRVASTNIVDYSHISKKYFVDLPETEYTKPLLWFQSRCSHSVLDAYEGDKVGCDDDLYRFLLERQGLQKGYSPIEGNNVAHYAYAALRALGCSPIIFIGMDQALSFHNSHAPGIPLHDEWSASISRFQSLEFQEFRLCYFIADWKIEREDQYGNPLLTDRLLEASAMSFESILARDRDALVFNCTEGGRPMKGAPDRPLREVLEEYCGDPFPIDEVFTRAAAVRSHKDELLRLGMEGIQDLKQQTDALKDIIRDGKRAMKKGEKDVLKGKTPVGIQESLTRLNQGVKDNRRAYVFIKTFTMGDDFARKRIDREVEEEGLPPIRRMRMEIQREHGFLIALERAIKKWEDVLKIGEERLRLAQEKGFQAVREFDAEARLADLEAAE